MSFLSKPNSDAMLSAFRKVDQLVYDLRHLQTGFHNYQQRKIAKVCTVNLPKFFSDAAFEARWSATTDIHNLTFQCYAVFYLHKFYIQELESREREELLNRRFEPNVSLNECRLNTT